MVADSDGGVRVTVRPCFQRISRQNSNFPAIFFEFEISAICITLESVENFPPYSFIEENGGSVDAGAYCHVYSVSDTHLQSPSFIRRQRQRHCHCHCVHGSRKPQMARGTVNQ